MGILSITHPDIMEFVAAKRTKGRWNNFNVSIGVTNAFMEAVEADADWYLTHKAQPSKALIDAGAYQADNGDWVYRTIKAREIWDLVMKSTYDFAEPGIVFLDAMNKDNNLRYAETIAATNPCGEQPLPAYGCCDLGPIILSKFVQNPFTKHAKFDFAAFGQVIATQVRFLDNVLDVTMWPLDEQKAESDSKRRVGVGFTALGNTLAMLGLRYDSDEGRHFAKMISETMRDKAYLASVDLAKEKGAFPLFNADKYLDEGTLHLACQSIFKMKSANLASVTAICCRSRQQVL
jgi:ribonucleoside-diphosphate reductase alpha chain